VTREVLLGAQLFEHRNAVEILTALAAGRSRNREAKRFQLRDQRPSLES